VDDLAASYSGPPSRALAEELATEIRNPLQPAGPMFSIAPPRIDGRAGADRTAQRGAEKAIRGSLESGRHGDPHQDGADRGSIRRPGRRYKDDVTARKKLDEFRKLKPPSSGLQQTRYVPDASGKMHEEAGQPVSGCVCLPQSAMPVEKPKQDADLGKRLKEYNAPESFSLLKCPKPYTLVVKEFKGATDDRSLRGRPARRWRNSAWAETPARFSTAIAKGRAHDG